MHRRPFEGRLMITESVSIAKDPGLNLGQNFPFPSLKIKVYILQLMMHGPLNGAINCFGYG